MMSINKLVSNWPKNYFFSFYQWNMVSHTKIYFSGMLSTYHNEEVYLKKYMVRNNALMFSIFCYFCLKSQLSSAWSDHGWNTEIPTPPKQCLL